MAMNKLERIEKDIEKTKGKIAELQKQLRELEAAKTEQENLQIVQLVRGLNMTPQEFAAFVRGGPLQAVKLFLQTGQAVLTAPAPHLAVQVQTSGSFFPSSNKACRSASSTWLRKCTAVSLSSLARSIRI